MNGQPVPPLSAADAESKFSPADPDIKSKLLRPTELKHGESVTGFAFFPAGAYTSGFLKLIDHRTGDIDDYAVNFEASAKARDEDRAPRDTVHSRLGSGERCKGNPRNTGPREASETSTRISLRTRPGSAEMNGKQGGALKAQKLPRATTEERRWAAIHEAGHAIVAAYFGHTLADATVESRHAHLIGQTERRTTLHPGPDGKPALQEGTTDRQLEEGILVALAGPQAERMAGRREDIVEAGAATDRQSIHAYLYALGCTTPGEAASVAERLQRELDELLSRLWPSVEPVARALFLQGAIRYEEIRVMVERRRESSEQGDD